VSDVALGHAELLGELGEALLGAVVAEVADDVEGAELAVAAGEVDDLQVARHRALDAGEAARLTLEQHRADGVGEVALDGAALGALDVLGGLLDEATPPVHGCFADLVETALLVALFLEGAGGVVDVLELFELLAVEDHDRGPSLGRWGRAVVAGRGALSTNASGRRRSGLSLRGDLLHQRALTKKNTGRTMEGEGGATLIVRPGGGKGGNPRQEYFNACARLPVALGRRRRRQRRTAVRDGPSGPCPAGVRLSVSAGPRRGSCRCGCG